MPPTMRGTIIALLLLHTAATTLAAGHVRGNKLANNEVDEIQKNAVHPGLQRDNEQSQIILDSTTAVKTTTALNEIIDNEEDARNKRLLKSGKGGKGGR
mmetsp:Transcript_9450/g.14205  ORF Transcript_9450/g.14205 Transcript_9450/m.14205 type:complete len:99 (-) Transcript_9450:279-575(-)